MKRKTLILFLAIILIMNPIGARAKINSGICKRMDNILYQSLLFPRPKKTEFKYFYATANVNVRESPNIKSKKVGIIYFNERVKCVEELNHWYKIEYNKNTAYVNKDYFNKKQVSYIELDVPHNNGFKSYMPYALSNGKSIFISTSKQKLLQDNYAYDGSYGIRMINGRYCVAIGSHFTTNIGQYFDLVLENGVVIPCVLADAKADVHTDSSNIFTLHNNCCSEFIVNNNILDNNAKKYGDISKCTEEWESPVDKIIIYEKNILKEN